MKEQRQQDNVPTRELLAYFDTKHVELLGARAVIQGGKDAKLIAGLWKSHGDVMVKALMDDYFASSDPWIRDHGYSVGKFLHEASKLLARRQRRPPVPDVASETWQAECRRLHDRRCNGQVGHANRMHIDAVKAKAES